jgi:hypothetical protein
MSFSVCDFALDERKTAHGKMEYTLLPQAKSHLE